MGNLNESAVKQQQEQFILQSLPSGTEARCYKCGGKATHIDKHGVKTCGNQRCAGPLVFRKDN